MSLWLGSHLTLTLGLVAGRNDSGDYADINTDLTRQTSSYDGDVEGEAESEDIGGDKGALHSNDPMDDDPMDDDPMDDDGERYLSDSSSQDTVRERSMQRPPRSAAIGELLDSSTTSGMIKIGSLAIAWLDYRV